MKYLRIDFTGARRIVVALVLAVLIGFPGSSWGQGRTDILAKTGDATPSGNGVYSVMTTTVLNNAGQAAFNGFLTGTSGGTTDNSGLFVESVNGGYEIARLGQAAPDGNGSLLGPGLHTINDSGTVAFYSVVQGTTGGTADNSGIFLGSGGAITQLARKGQAAPDGNGLFLDFEEPDINSGGSVAFKATFSGTVGGTNTDNGIYLANSLGIAQIAREGQGAPDGNGLLANMYNASVNDSGQVVFQSNLRNTSGASADAEAVYRAEPLVTIARRGSFFANNFNAPLINNNGTVGFNSNLVPAGSGIFLGSGGAITQVVAAGVAAPEGNGTFSVFNLVPSLNNQDQVAFSATLTGTSGGSDDNRGLYRWSAGTITKILRMQDPAPDGNGTFSFFDFPVMNDSGTLAFIASLTGTSGGISDDRGVFLSDGIDVVTAVREGQVIDGSVVTAIQFLDGGYRGINASGFNNLGQVAYKVDLGSVKDVIGLFTPDLHWRTGASGNWDTAGSWTLGLTPGFVHDVFIDPSTSLLVNGPSSNTTVRRLEVGGGTGTAELILQSPAAISTTLGLSIHDNGILSGSGNIIGDVTSSGTISPGNSPGIIEIDGKLSLGANSTLEFELGGLLSSEFDQLIVSGDTSLDGALSVSLINGLMLGGNMSFEIIDVGGLLSGQFIGLGEGGLVGNFGGRDLLISYTAGDGNDVALYTAVPEPGVCTLLGLCLVGICLGGRRRRSSLKFVPGTFEDPSSMGNKPARCMDRPALRQSKSHLFMVVLVASIPILVCGPTSRLHAQGRTETIVQTGDAAPDGNGTFTTFGVTTGTHSTINQSGQVFFFGNLSGTSGGSNDNHGLFIDDNGSLIQVVRKGQSAPDGNGVFSSLFMDGNNNGQLGFRASLTGTSGGATDNGGIFLGNGGPITQIAREGQSAPDGNGTYSSFANPLLNDFGQVAFSANLTGTSGGSTDNQGIFLASGGIPAQIVRTGQAAADGNGVYSNFYFYGSNNAGSIAFAADLTGTYGGNSDNSGMFRASSGGATQIAREGQLAPDGNGEFFGFGVANMNKFGQLAFYSTLSGTSGGLNDDSGIYRGSGGALTQIAREGQLAPDGSGAFSGLAGTPRINDQGQVAFRAFLSGTPNGVNDDTGVFRGDGVSLVQIMREGQSVPDGNGVFRFLSDPRMNNAGQVVILSTLDGTAGGSADNYGIFTGDGIDTIQVARRGQSLGGSTVTDLTMSGSDAVNDFGQVVYTAALANGNQVVSRWTPDLHWRSASSGTWDDVSNWTLGLTPALVHDVLIDSAASVTVTGPSGATTVRSLQVGGGTGIATLDLAGGSVLTATNGVSIASTGVLTGGGVIAGDILNDGVVIADNVTVQSTLTNNNVIRGNGRLHANIVNNPTGNIRANNGDVLQLTGPSLTNAGRIEVINGEIQVAANLANQAGTGLITGRNAVMRFNGGVTNDGSIGLSFGTSDIFGDINNTASGIINVSGGANVTFYDDLTQNGTMVVASVGNTHSAAVLFGNFSGAGGFTGGGDVFAFGDLRPGNSPASVLMDGNLYLGPSTDTIIELGGPDVGSFDQLLVTGDLGLDGELLVSLLGGYLPGNDREFIIADVGGNLLGQFSGLAEGALVGNFGGRDMFISYARGNGNDVALFTAVPEPTALAVCILIGGTLVSSQRRKRDRLDAGPTG